MYAQGSADFNPRTPHGVRPGPVRPSWPRRDISTHAPLTGCDKTGVRLWDRTDLFQSTHPSRGATLIGLGDCTPHLISIHAPLTGCDGGLVRHPTNITNFNPRTPHGVRLACSLSQWSRRIISIHAPLTGCDWRLITMTKLEAQFQSTHPSRGATEGRWSCSPHQRFQSTHPSRGATYVKNALRWASAISIHAPLTGCDPLVKRKNFALDNFNPRTPHGVRQSQLADYAHAY